MSLLGHASSLASTLAKDKAEQMARRTARKAAAWLAVAVLLSLTLVFASIAGFVALSAQVGTVSAALIVAGGCLFLALAVAALSRSRPTATTRREAELKAEIDRIAASAREEVQKASPYLVAGAFVSGFFSGRRK